MTNLIDDIKRDREAGTPGVWSVCEYDGGDVDHWAAMPSVQAEDKYDCAIVHWDGFTQRFWRSANGDCQIHANARRIARVPAMEAAILAAVDALKALKFAMGPDGELDDCNKAMELCSSTLASLEAGQ